MNGELSECANWSKIKIYSLGRFEVLIDGKRFCPTGKAQRKPLDLLKCLIAHGGRKVSSSTIIRFLWPDSEGDAAPMAFDSTVFRLRKLLGRSDAILLSDGLLTLNSEIVWVDIWEFERLLGKRETINSTALRNCETIQEMANEAFLLYQGHFLGHEEERPWMLSMRERLRSKCLRHLANVGKHWEDIGQWDKAAELYQRGLELDNLAEELYQRLMSIYEQRGQSASALEVYRRCRMILSVLLGAKPSKKMEDLYRSLIGD
jgi:two-component SAPR family response regulator